MKIKAIPVVLSLLIGFSNLSVAQIYVKYDATGANNGTSWNDAFINLKSALISASAGMEIWVSAGTYRPDTAGGNPANIFLINKNLRLLGGFAGTETSAEQRDPAANITILSGDLNSDDIPGDFTTNRSDNSNKVVQITHNVDNNTWVDGFTITGAYSSDYGGGLFSIGAPTVRRCTFVDNYAHYISGAGLFFYQPTASGAVVEYCSFDKNQAGYSTSGAGILVHNVTTGSITVRYCTFTNNTGGRGSGLYCLDGSAKVHGCTFSDNMNENAGGAIFFFSIMYPELTLTVDSCQFTGNHASSGGAMYVGAQFDGHAPQVHIRYSDFTGNDAESYYMGWPDGRGGALTVTLRDYIQDAGIYLNNCRFFQNYSNSSSGVLSLSDKSISAVIEIDSCLFDDNNNISFPVGTMDASFQGANVQFKLSNSAFTNKFSGLGNVDLSNSSSGNNFLIHNVLFKKNTATSWPGLHIVNNVLGAWSGYKVSECTFLENTASNNGGGLSFWTESPVQLEVQRCTFEKNIANSMEGALGIEVNHPGSHVNVRISECRMIDNQSPVGAAIKLNQHYVNGITQGAFIRIENCLVADNTGDSSAVDIQHPGRLELINCTIANNNARGIQCDKEGVLTLQNTILYNPGFTEIYLSSTNTSLQSRGGNLLGDASLGSFAHATDQQNTDPLFVGDGDYHLSDASPAIDKGMDYGLPQTDLDGNPRITGCVDIGAYESATVVSPDCLTGSNEAFAGQLVLSPSPCTDRLNIQIPASTTTAFDLRVFDIRGSVVVQGFISETDLLDVSRLASGMYMVQVFAGNAVYSGRFVKN